MNLKLILENWDKGPELSENLCSALLGLEGYKKIDPQNPRGGPDGKKDIICRNYSPLKYIAACYFPRSKQSIVEITKKFKKDIVGIKENQAEGFIFFTGQYLTCQQKEDLTSLTKLNKNNVEIYDCERIANILDLPKAYGTRLKYFNIGMSIDEQVSFFDDYKDELNNILTNIYEQTTNILTKIETQSSSLSQNLTEFINLIDIEELTVEKLLYLHKQVTLNTQLPLYLRGIFRKEISWVGPKGCSIEQASLITIPPENIEIELKNLLKTWNDEFLELINLTEYDMLRKLAKFHFNFLKIHPFYDANGRIARILTMKQFFVLKEEFTLSNLNPRQYYSALKASANGNFEDLVYIIGNS